MQVICLNPVKISHDPEINDTRPCNTEMDLNTQVKWRGNFKCKNCGNEVIVAV